ncbi:unnamed protein product [Rotaria magnacalcarata]|uniref:Uncharacterized protein n=1 Tax=Rotaria magnacalcarata TaxID=392030 RepID=A0A816U267_9BILA|nr:unnamed protein product [Rotaria magnacalcarata]
MLFLVQVDRLNKIYNYRKKKYAFTKTQHYKRLFCSNCSAEHKVSIADVSFHSCGILKKILVYQNIFFCGIFHYQLLFFSFKWCKRTNHKIIKRKKHFFSETTLQLFCFIQVATVNVLRD